mmetsp:Transcript_71519/g.167517  ORF Transcript_71519/g.167517 Transcript_71519/m.167517 type:complete len:943 (+) Transcript_71519:31-2859(+)
MVDYKDVDTPNLKRRKSALVTEALDLIDYDKSGDLGQDEVQTLLIAMGLPSEVSTAVMNVVFDGCQATDHDSVTEAILRTTHVQERSLATLLGRVTLFQKAFRRLDLDRNGKINFPEVLGMLECLSMERKYAADVMAFLDADDSGEITWQEFVRGMSDPQFSVLFPQITLEALVSLPSSLAQNKIVSAEEEAEAIKELPAVEKSLYWLLSLMYGRSSPKHREHQEEEGDVARNKEPPHPVPMLRHSASSFDDDALSGDSSDSDSSDSESTATTKSSETAHARTAAEISLPVALPNTVVKSRKARDVAIITRTEPKDAQKAQVAIIRPKKSPVVVTRSVAKNPDKVRLAVVRPPREPLALPAPPSSRKNTVRPPPTGAAALLRDASPGLDPQARGIPGEVAATTPLGLPVKLEEAPERPRRPSFSAPVAALARRGSVVGAAVSSMLAGLPGNLGLTHKTNKVVSTPTLSMKEVVSSMREMDVKDVKAHVLTEQKRNSLWRCSHGAVLAGVIAGVGAAFFAQALNDVTGTMVDEEEDWLAFNAISGSFSLVWSLAEMVVCCIAALVAAVRMTRICGILLVPMDKERAMLAGSLARAALELGHPRIRTFGIDPHKRASKCLLLIYALIYMGSRGVTKFIVKLIVKKVAPRTLLKFAELAPLVIEILINVAFNTVTVRYAMNEVMVCTLGPSAAVEVTSQLIRAHRQSHLIEEPLSDELKCLALRAVGVSITYKMQMHPNSRVLLNHIVNLFIDEGFVKRAKDEYGQILEEARVKRKTAKSFMSKPSKASVGTAAGSIKSRGLAVGRWFGCCMPRPEKTQESLYEELADLGLDDEDLFFDGLTGLNHQDALFACSMLLLALLLDGRIGNADWAFIQRAARSVDPPLKAKWSSALHLVNIYCDGRQMTAGLFHDVFEASMDGEESRASCCDVATGGLRTGLGYINCC